MAKTFDRTIAPAHHFTNRHAYYNVQRGVWTERCDCGYQARARTADGAHQAMTDHILFIAAPMKLSPEQVGQILRLMEAAPRDR